MKQFALAGVLTLALCAGDCMAIDDKTKASSEAATPAEQNNGSKRPLKHIDLGEEPVSTVGTMSQGQNYSENSGFPNVVQSDGDMEI